MRSPLSLGWGLVFAFLSRSYALNRFLIPDMTLPAGAREAEIILRADNDVALYAFSFGIKYDTTALEVTKVTLAGTLAAGADFFDGIVDSARGLAGYGCVLDFDFPFLHTIPPGTGQPLAKLVINVLGAGGASTQVLLETVPTNPDPKRPVKNVMTTEKGVSVDPELIPGTINITENRAPRIISISENSGLAGKDFHVVGEFLSGPGLRVSVCGAAATAILQPDWHTLLIKAPACATLGFAPLEICTDCGCAMEPRGFEYRNPDSPVITSISGNRGQAGTIFQVGGDFLDKPGLQVKVCGSLASAILQAGGHTILVTAPACSSLGFSPLEVCTEDGCDTREEGFEYLPEKAFLRGNVNSDSAVDLSDGVSILSFLFLGGPPAGCMDAMDSDDSGTVNISDAVHIFNWLFLGGPGIPEPYPLPGKDPTPDSLPTCFQE